MKNEPNTHYNRRNESLSQYINKKVKLLDELGFVVNKDIFNSDTNEIMVDNIVRGIIKK